MRATSGSPSGSETLYVAQVIVKSGLFGSPGWHDRTPSKSPREISISRGVLEIFRASPDAGNHELSSNNFLYMRNCEDTFYESLL